MAGPRAHGCSPASASPAVEGFAAERKCASGTRKDGFKFFQWFGVHLQFFRSPFVSSGESCRWAGHAGPGPGPPGGGGGRAAQLCMALGCCGLRAERALRVKASVLKRSLWKGVSFANTKMSEQMNQIIWNDLIDFECGLYLIPLNGNN